MIVVYMFIQSSIYLDVEFSKSFTSGILGENNSDISALVVSNKNHTTRFEISRPHGFRESTIDVTKIVFGL